MADQLDPQAIALAQAIRSVESGGSTKALGQSGEKGAYQFMPNTWANYSKQAGVNVPLEQATLQQQNQVAYHKIKEWKDAGYNPGQIASMWNAGEGKPNAYKENYAGTNDQGVKYDTPAYAKAVAEHYQNTKGQYINGGMANAGTPGQQTQPGVDTYGATFPYQQGDNPLVAGAKALGNVPSSVGNFAGGLFNAATHPIDTLTGLGRTAVGGVQALTGGGNPDDINTQTFNAFTDALKNRYGSLDNLSRTAVNDPFGIGLDILSVLSGGAAAIGKTGELANITSKVGRVVSAPIEASVAKTSQLAGDMARYSTARATGLQGDTISRILEAPKEFTPEVIASASRKDIAETVKTALDTRKEFLSDVGAGYDEVRSLQAPNLATAAGDAKVMDLGGGKKLVYNLPDAPNDLLDLPELRRKVDMLTADANAPADVLKQTKDMLAAREKVETIPHEVKLPKNFIESQFKTAAGIGFKDGKAFATGASKVRDSKDVRAVQNFYDLWKPVLENGKMNTTEYLNFRSDLAKMAKFDREIGKSSDLENLAGIIRANLNSGYRKQIPGLKDLDELYAVEKSQLDELSKGLIDKDGNLTDAAINKIANAGNVGKDQLLARLEQLVPGITHRIQIQQAIEDIQHAVKGDRVVGAYTHSALQGAGTIGAVTGITTGNIPLLAGSLAMSILTAPKSAVALLRTFGFQKDLVKGVIYNLSKGVGGTGELGAAGLKAAAPVTATASAGALGQQSAQLAQGSSTALPTQ